MTGSELSKDDRNEILARDILPLYFPDNAPGESPTLVLLAGQAGSGRSRAIPALRHELNGDLAALSGDDLRPFHPRFFELTEGTMPNGAKALGQATSDWLRGCIRYARENHRSLLLEGTFHDTDTAIATANRFSSEGFETRVVVVGSRRTASLLTQTSKYLADLHAGRAGRWTSRESHDRGFEDTRTLVDALEKSSPVDRLTIVNRAGKTIFDARAKDVDAFKGAGASLAAAQTERMSAIEATQWLSELHWMTEFALSRRDLPSQVIEVLIDLHESSVRQIIPELPVPVGGTSAINLERRAMATLKELRGALPRSRRSSDIAAPAVVPQHPETAGPSR